MAAFFKNISLCICEHSIVSNFQMFLYIYSTIWIYLELDNRNKSDNHKPLHFHNTFNFLGNFKIWLDITICINYAPLEK